MNELILNHHDLEVLVDGMGEYDFEKIEDVVMHKLVETV